MDNELICYLCGNLFTNPVLLPCGHNLCLSCAQCHYQYCTDDESIQTYEVLEVSCESSRNFRVKCPICNFDFALPNGGAHGFLRNRIVEKMIAKSAKGTTRNEFWCEFCVGATVKASYMCRECEYWYCKECLESMHQLKGPLAYHTITEPQEKPKRDCTIHDNLMEFYCLSCKAAICQKCFSDLHKDHKIEHLQQYSKRLRDDIAAKLELFMESCNDLKGIEEDHEKLFFCIKLAASEAEAHIKRQTENLMKLIGWKKEQFLNEIESKYFAVSSKISNAAQECKAAANEGRSFAEFISLVLREDNNVHFVQTAKPILKRLETSLASLNAAPKSDWSVVSIFNRLSIDVTSQMTSISNLNWLQVPCSPSFDKERCYGRNCKLVLKWYPLECQIDSYILETKIHGKEDAFRNVYNGKECSYVLAGVKYGVKVTARVRAKNRAGTGTESDEILLEMPEGFDLRFSTELSSKGFKFSTDLKAVKSTTATPLTAIGDSILTSDVHYWCCRVQKFPSNDQKPFIEIGVVEEKFRGGLQKGHVAESHSLQILLPEACNTGMSSPSQQHKTVGNGKVTLSRYKREIKDTLLAFVLDLNNHTFSIFTNGHLICSNDAENITFNIADGCFRVFIRTIGAGIHIDSVSSLPMPSTIPDPPRILPEKCYTRNTKSTIVWSAVQPDDGTCVYLLEAKFSELKKPDTDSHQFKELYRGRQTRFVFESHSYATTIKARVKCVNILGIGGSSLEIVLKTPPGLTFNLVTGKSDTLQLKENGTLFFDHKHKESCLLADVDLSHGKHCWGFRICKCDNCDICIGFGVADGSIAFKMFREQSNFRAVLLYNSVESLHGDSIENSCLILTKPWRHFEDLRVILALDFTTGTLGTYVNGLLIKGSMIEDLSKSTFSDLDGIIKPALWIRGGGVEVTPLSGLPFPEIPGPPVIRRDISRLSNTCLYLEWKVAGALDSVDFFIVEISTLHQKYAAKRTDKFREVFRGLKTDLEIEDLTYNNKIACRVFAANFNGKSEPSEIFECQTVRGFQFQFDGRTAHPDVKLINNTTVALSSPVYATIMGSVSISSGSHYWEVLIEQFESQNETAVLGIGVAAKELKDPILGEDSFSYAVQIHQHPKIACSNTSNKIVLKKSNTDAEMKIIGIRINMESHWMDVYFHGDLMKRRRKSKRSFKIEHGKYYPAFSLYGTNMRISLRSGVDFEERYGDDV